MLEFWIQNGEAQGMISPSTKMEDILSPICQRDGSLTCFSQKIFSMLNAKSKADLSKKVTRYVRNFEPSNRRLCSICGATGAGKLKGWMFPFIIDKNKFPNLYPNGSVESLNACKACLMKSLRAYGAALFSGQRVNRNTVHLNMILFFSDDASSLAQFRRTYLTGTVVPEYYYNWKPRIRLDIVYFPHEFLMQMLNYVASKMAEAELTRQREVGVVLISFSQGRSKRLYEHVETAITTSPLLIALEKFNENSERSRFFPFFRSMREETPMANLTPNAFINRDKFFQELLLYRKINWAVLEDILFYRLSVDRPIAYLHGFLKEFMAALSDSDAQYYDAVSRQGRSLVSSLLERGEQPKAVKAAIYELRRERDDLGEFLDIVNVLQLRAGSAFDDRVFKEHEDVFFKLRTFFMIGMTNALFQSRREEETEETASAS
jgi:hypothetical protein